ncbi:beta-phosphoglucomutase [Sediminibacillus albus]|uniref:Beta-phosphoglucomutase n=1 Tax=Sediminibacillus albus TaxID=407036 RepID=A0A1G9CZK4_9BACI|nr:beta-phosphoglucomutase [Sediminibacillus albus]SDK57141.1 beta-phosphoglucomutase [Sediminibacillus albus]
MAKIEAIIYDLDGVITDTAEYHFLAWKTLADELHIPFDRAFNEQLKGLSRIDSLNLILEQGSKSYTEKEKEQLAAKKNEHYQTLIRKISPDDLLPGVEAFMKEVKQAGIKTGLASASKNAQTVIQKLEITDLLDTVVDAAEVKRGKPDPEVFLTAAEQLGANPDNCIGIEDARSGVAAIKSAGMFAVGIGDRETLSRADWIIEDSSLLSLSLLKQKYD